MTDTLSHHDTPAPSTRLVIVRHGEAVCNADDYIGGHASCRGLTARGEEQVEALARRLRSTGELDGAAAIWTSILPRAIETATIIGRALQMEITGTSCVLCERHPGEADGLTWQECEQRYGSASFPGIEPDVALSPGGETWAQFVARARTALERLALDYSGRLVVVVAHGGIIDASLVSFFGLPLYSDGIRFHAENASLTEWAYTGAVWQLRRFNDAAHLRGEPGSALRVPLPPWAENADVTAARLRRPSDQQA